MQISQEPIDALRAQVSVTLDKNDYKDRCDKILKAQRKQITLPGFRKGKVPMSIVASSQSVACTHWWNRNIC